MQEENPDAQIDLQKQESHVKILIQNKIEPVDIREIDEDSMMWTLNDSIDHEDIDRESDNSMLINDKDKKKKKKSIFHRSNAEKMEYLRKKNLEIDEKNERSPDKKNKLNNK